MSKIAKFSLASLIIILVGGALVAFSATTSINPGFRGVGVSSLNGTDLKTVYSEGLNFHAFWVKVVPINVRSQTITTRNLSASTSSGLPVVVDVTLRFKPQEENLPSLFQKYGNNYEESVIRPELRSAFRDAMDDFSPEDLYSNKRSLLQKNAETTLRDRLSKCFISLDTLLVRDIRLPQTVKDRIEGKVSAEQDLQTAKIEAEKLQIRGKAQAEYQKLVSNHLTPEFLRLKEIETNQKIAEVISQSPNTKIFFGDSGNSLTQSLIKANEATKTELPKGE